MLILFDLYASQNVPIGGTIGTVMSQGSKCSKPVFLRILVEDS